MSEQDLGRELGQLTDAEAADWILTAGPLEPAVHEIASRIVGILGRRQRGGAAQLRDRMDELVRAEIRAAIESAFRAATKLAEEAERP